MQNYMIIRQKVTDLAKFQQAFDQLKPERAKAGLTDLGQFCAEDDASTVIVEKFPLIVSPVTNMRLTRVGE